MLESTNINEKGLMIIKVIEDFVAKQNKRFDELELDITFDLKQVGFYSKTDWKNRGEEYCLESDVVMSYDGGFMHHVMNDNWEMREDLEKDLEKIGLYMEPGYSWCCGFYAI